MPIQSRSRFLSTIAIMGCAAMLTTACSTFQSPPADDAGLMHRQGERIVSDGENLISRGERRIRQGEERVTEGQDLIVEGEDMIVEGRDMIQTGERSVRRGQEMIDNSGINQQEDW